MRGLPHLAALVERHKDDPFALIGVATDRDRDEYLRRAREAGLTWRNAWASGTSGAWPTAWGIQRYPSVFVLDARGVLRFVGVRDAALDRAVLVLVAEAKAAATERPR